MSVVTCEEQQLIPYITISLNQLFKSLVRSTNKPLLAYMMFNLLAWHYLKALWFPFGRANLMIWVCVCSNSVRYCISRRDSTTQLPEKGFKLLTFCDRYQMQPNTLQTSLFIATFKFNIFDCRWDSEKNTLTVGGRITVRLVSSITTRMDLTKRKK